MGEKRGSHGRWHQRFPRRVKGLAILSAGVHFNAGRVHFPFHLTREGCCMISMPWAEAALNPWSTHKCTHQSHGVRTLHPHQSHVGHLHTPHLWVAWPQATGPPPCINLISRSHQCALAPPAHNRQAAERRNTGRQAFKKGQAVWVIRMGKSTALKRV